MRNISANSLATLQTQMGLEPVCLVAIAWGRNNFSLAYYSDKIVIIDNPTFSIDTRIMSITGLENTLKVSDNATSQACTIKMSDWDGALKNLIDNLDIHKSTCYIYQWFSSIPLSDAFLIFEGEILSPITWKEGDQTLEFDVTTKIDDKEIGFSLEQGQVGQIDEDSIGKPWPLGFGTNIKVATFKINSPPKGIVRHPIGWADPSLPQKIGQNSIKIGDYQRMKYLDEFYALEASYSAQTADQTINVLSKIYDALKASQSYSDHSDELQQIGDQVRNDTGNLSQSGSSGFSGSSSYKVPLSSGSYTGGTDSSLKELATTSSTDPTSGTSSSSFDPNKLLEQVRNDSFDTTSSYQSSGISSSTKTLVDNANDVVNNSNSIDLDRLKSFIDQAKSYKDQMNQLKKQYEDKAAQDAQQITQMMKDNDTLSAEYLRQKDYGTVASVINGYDFPRDTITVKINNYDLTGHFDGDSFHIDSLPVEIQAPNSDSSSNSTSTSTNTNIYNPADHRDIYRVPPRDEYIGKGKFVVINPGAEVILVSDYPLYYVANIIPSNIFEVMARKSSNGGQAVLTYIPQEYYTITSISVTTISNSPITYNCAAIKVNRALSTYNDGWEDEIFVSYISNVGPNIVAILEFLIQTYTTHGIDPWSFSFVASMVAGLPANFVLYDRKNIMNALEEICFQAAIGIKLSSGIFSLTYLPYNYTPIDTITENDIQFGSMELTHTSTEELVTKIVGNYKFNYLDKTPSQIVFRYNIDKYDTIEKTYDFYIFNIPACVYATLGYWIMRKGNTWKKLKFKTFLHKLNLEPFDTIWLFFQRQFVTLPGYEIPAIVESAKYNSDDSTIDMEVWVPIRIGELIQYNLAFPAASSFAYFPNNEEVTDGSSISQGNNLTDSGGNNVITPPLTHLDNTPSGYPGIDSNNSRSRSGGPVNIGNPGADVTPNNYTRTMNDSNTKAGVPQLGSPYTQSLSAPKSSEQPYNYRDYPSPKNPAVPQVTIPTVTANPICLIKFADKVSDTTYNAVKYPDGPNGTAGSKIKVTILQIDPNAIIPKDTWWFAISSNNNWYAQVPIWISASS